MDHSRVALRVSANVPAGASNPSMPVRTMVGPSVTLPSCTTYMVWWVRSTQMVKPSPPQACTSVEVSRLAAHAVWLPATPSTGLRPNRFWNFLMVAQSVSDWTPSTVTVPYPPSLARAASTSRWLAPCRQPPVPPPAVGPAPETDPAPLPGAGGGVDALVTGVALAPVGLAGGSANTPVPLPDPCPNAHAPRPVSVITASEPATSLTRHRTIMSPHRDHASAC